MRCLLPRHTHTASRAQQWVPAAAAASARARTQTQAHSANPRPEGRLYTDEQESVTDRADLVADICGWWVVHQLPANGSKHKTWEVEKRKQISTGGVGVRACVRSRARARTDVHQHE